MKIRTPKEPLSDKETDSFIGLIGSVKCRDYKFTGIINKTEIKIGSITIPSIDLLDTRYGVPNNESVAYKAMGKRWLGSAFDSLIIEDFTSLTNKPMPSMETNMQQRVSKYTNKFASAKIFREMFRSEFHAQADKAMRADRENMGTETSKKLQEIERLNKTLTEEKRALMKKNVR